MKGIVRLDKVASVYGGGHLHSVVHNAELENGALGHAGDLVTGERELETFEVPTTGSIAAKSAILVAQPEIMYDESASVKRQLGNFSTSANVPATAYDLIRDDIFSVSENMITALDTNVVEGNYVVLQNGSYKLKEATSTTTEIFVGKIIDIESVGTTTVVGANGSIGNTYKLVVIKVLKN